MSGNTNPPAPPDRRQRFNVRDFGAVGDGQHDDSAAIHRAFQEALDSGGGEIYFPPGVYSGRTGGR